MDISTFIDELKPEQNERKVNTWSTEQKTRVRITGVTTKQKRQMQQVVMVMNLKSNKEINYFNWW